MNVPRRCLWCSDPFLGRPNRRYCSQSCKHKQKRQRQRYREIKNELAHVERRLALARAERDRMAIRFLFWQSQQLRSDLVLASIGVGKRGANHLSNGERIA